MIGLGYRKRDLESIFSLLGLGSGGSGGAGGLPDIGALLGG